MFFRSIECTHTNHPDLTNLREVQHFYQQNYTAWLFTLRSLAKNRFICEGNLHRSQSCFFEMHLLKFIIFLLVVYFILYVGRFGCNITRYPVNGNTHHTYLSIYLPYVRYMKMPNQCMQLRCVLCMTLTHYRLLVIYGFNSGAFTVIHQSDYICWILSITWLFTLAPVQSVATHFIKPLIEP